jgi:polyhydroxybutyrate depolymerase
VIFLSLLGLAFGTAPARIINLEAYWFDTAIGEPALPADLTATPGDYAGYGYFIVQTNAPVAGACWLEPLKLERPVPMCYITGTADPLNLIEGGVPKLATGASDKVRAKPKPPVRDSILKWAKAVGCPTAPKATSESNGVRIEPYGSGRDGAEVVYVTVEGLGHTWAGGKSLVPEFLVGKRSDKLKATDFIWEFFQKHPMPASATRPGTGH